MKYWVFPYIPVNVDTYHLHIVYLKVSINELIIWKAFNFFFKELCTMYDILHHELQTKVAVIRIAHSEKRFLYKNINFQNLIIFGTLWQGNLTIDQFHFTSRKISEKV